MVGVLLVLAAALRLGFVANFISEPVLTGFKAGIGVVIVVDQIPKLLGIHFPKGPFFGNLLSIVKGIPETSVPTLCVALAMIALLFALEHWTPRAPAPLIAVAAGIGGMALLGEPAAQERGELRLVLDDQHPHGPIVASNVRER